MGLPASQRRILERIENALRGSDPRLAALFSIFTRLNRDEEMPRIEQVRAKAIMFLIRVRYRLAAFASWFRAPRRARLRTALFFPVALAIVASAVLVGAGFPSANRCAPIGATARPAHTRTKTKTKVRICTPLANPAIFGR
jgi:hypothetical protein